MSSFRLLLWLLPRRLRSAWGLLAVTAFGVLAAVTIMALGAMYSHALAEAGLRHSLAVASPNVINGRVIVRNRPLSPDDYAALRTGIEQIIDRSVGYLQRDRNRYARMLPTLPLTREGMPYGIRDVPLGRPFFVTGFQEHAQLSAGRWPSDTVGQDANGQPLIEAVMGVDAARSLGWTDGQRAWMVAFPGSDESPRRYIAVDIVGIAEAANPRAEYWMGASDYFRIGDWEGRPVAPIYVAEKAYFDGIGREYPTLVGDFGWLVYFNPDGITARTVSAARDNLTALETDVNAQFPRSFVLTGLENSRGTGLLAVYQRGLTLARAPLYLFISLVVVVILYFLALAVTLLAGARAAESSMLRSRGASAMQVGGLLALGEGLIVLLATLVGPLLAWGIGSAFLLDTINPVSRPGAGESPLGVGLSWQMYAMGAVGGLLCMAVLTAAGGSLARLGILDFLRARSRPPAAPWLQRYYIDLLAVAALAVLVWQIRQRGGFVEGTLTGGGGPALDPLLLLAPAAALIALAFLLLRALPWAMAAAAFAAQRSAPAWISLTLRQMARRPLPYASLIVVVTLAAALGVFAGSFQATLSRSEADQARHGVGGDMTLIDARFSGRSAPEKVAALNDIDGVNAVSAVVRESVGFLDGPFQRGYVLGVDPLTFAAASWWRNSFAVAEPTDLDTLMAPLRRTLNPQSAGIALPAGAERIAIRARRADRGVSGAAPLPSYRLWARVANDSGSYRNLELGTLSSQFGGDEWRQLTADLPDPASQWRLVSVHISGESFARTPPGALLLDDIIAYGAGLPPDGALPDGVLVEGFEEIGPWTALPQAGGVADRAERTADAAHSGAAGMRITWEEPLGRSARGIIIPPGPLPLPAIAGPGFAAGQIVRITVDGYIVPARVTAVVSHFPTLDEGRSFLVMSVHELRAWLAQAPGAEPITPDEWWFDIADDADRPQTAAAIRAVGYRLSYLRDRAHSVSVATRNPLAGGAWNALTGIGLAALSLAVGLALCAHAAVAVRGQRVDLSVGAALGTPRWQRYAGLALERGIIAALGSIAGGLVGWGLAWWTLGELTSVGAGGTVTPPVVFVAEGAWLAATFVCLGIAAGAAIILAGAAASRLRPAETLRAAE